MKKMKTAMKSLLCALFAVVLAVTTCAEPVQAGAWRETESLCKRYATPNPILGTYTTDSTLVFYPTGGFYFNDGSARAGETIYIYNYAYTCNGIEMYAANYKGRTVCFRKKDIDPDKIQPVNKAAYKPDAKIKQTAIVGDPLKPNNWFYVYSKPNEKLENVYGVFIAKNQVNILKKNYNSEWTQIWWNGRICYIKTEAINFKDSYLVGARDSLMSEIKQAKQAKLTYSGILKKYENDLTEKEFYKLAAKWCKATGNKEFKSSKKVTNKALNEKTFNKLMQKMLKSAKANDAVYDTCLIGSPSTMYGVSRERAIVCFQRAYIAYRALTQHTNDLIACGNYSICPADDPSQCLDLYEWSNKAGATIGLYKNSYQNNQLFTLLINNGFYNMDNYASKFTLTGSKKGLYQEDIGYHSQKLTFEFNDDGTVCIKNGEGLYMDVQDGTPLYAEKSGKSSQNFILKYHSINRQMLD